MNTTKVGNMSFFNPLKILLVIKTVSVVIVLGTVIASVTPTKSDDAFMIRVRKTWIGLLSKVGGIVGYDISSDPCETLGEQKENMATTK